ncbi:benzoate 4-monooxygenase cytochrome P450 [Metarhizium guizhouense ARSEF 977]|uniref:Benzoate 4-monooxygenase cytochrome P450 n=1 Tax=Metarhizium guizhouense (strain ARSEF 977) TaxID=1276136 RepID=A0A0B4GZK2_METGA|nr:benzoate 4-monooxygenase cytochrome P450 [Metarhizium guizhouense ARSEF 977]
MAFAAYNSSAQMSQFIVLLLFTPIGILVTVLRFVAARRSQRNTDIEDWLAVLATIFFAMCNLSAISIINGRTLEQEVGESPSDYKLMRKWDMIGLYMFFGHLLTVKLSILALYRRIFGIHRTYRLWIYAFAAFQTGLIVIFCIVQAIQCEPFGRYFDVSVAGHCRPENIIVLGGSVPDTFVDFGLVVLAMVMIRQLHLTSSVKWKLRLLFGVGFIVGAIGFIKIVITYSTDSFYAFSMISLWSCVQMFLSLVCACLPVYGPILPSSVLLHQFFIRITSYAKNSRNKSSPPSNILGAEDGDSTKGLAAWTEAPHGHGNIVRVAPNELAFSSPQAFTDIYGSHDKYVELFAKTQINNHGNDKHGGLVWEWDPIRHRQVSKQMAPAFSGRALRAKEPTIHKYVDLFVQRMRSLATSAEGISLKTWISWLAFDISADTAYNRQMNALQDMKEPPYLTILTEFNKAVVVIQTCWRFPFLSPLKYMYLLLISRRSHSDARKHSRQLLQKRIQQKGNVEHPDFFEHLMPQNRELPDRQEMRHLEQVAGQLLLAGYEGPSTWLYLTTYYLANDQRMLEAATREVREAFESYDEITATSAAKLPYLAACLSESLRLMPLIPNGMPVVSPGAMVDGHFIPKGVVCQTSPTALAHDGRNFHDALHYRPERWLPKSHALYNSDFASDYLDASKPFSQGPRMCPGKEIAMWEGRIYAAKVLWTFDVKLVEGQNIDMANDWKAWGMFVKPDVRVRFVPRC